MSNKPTIHWEGKSGREYEYQIFPIGTSFKNKPGNYIFAKETEQRRWRPVYIGQTENLDGRLENHNEEQCAKRNGATHIHAHLNGNRRNRKAEEKDLIRRWDPTCNEVHIG